MAATPSENTASITVSTIPRMANRAIPAPAILPHSFPCPLPICRPSRTVIPIAKLESGGLKATCCNDPCYEEKNKDSGALYVRPNDETPSLVNYRGKIIICPKGLKNNAEAWGGCGCLILHEVLHVIGLKANEEEFNRQNYRRDNAMIKLANELLKTSKKHCKGYDVK